MDIKHYKIADLKNELDSDLFWESDNMPITKHRALSFINNPRADKNDIILIVAFEFNKTVGYIGIVPDIIYLNDNEYKIGVLSTWWVNPTCLKLGIGKKLLFCALSCYDGKLYLSGYTKVAESIYKKTNLFHLINIFSGITINKRFSFNDYYSRSILKIITPTRFKKIITNIINKNLIKKQKHWIYENENIIKNIRFEYVDKFDLHAEEFIQQHNKNELFRRDFQVLNWIIDYPWVLETPLNDGYYDKYYFSSVARKFNFINILIYDLNNKLVGILLLKQRDSHLTIPYIYYEDDYFITITKLLVLHIFQLDIMTISIFNYELINQLKSLKSPLYIMKSKNNNKPLISNQFKSFDLSNYILQDGDGDLVFT